MYLYKKTIKPKNTAGKITSVLLLLCGALLFISASSTLEYFYSIIQFIGVIFIGISIYIASAYLLKEYTFTVSLNSKHTEDDASLSEKYDFIITEKRYNRDIKVLHFGMDDVSTVRVVDPKNIKKVRAERKNMRRFTYNTEFAASRHIELQAKLDGEEYSIFVSYDENLLHVFQDLVK